jgi:prophage maintenance system killer protein
MSPKQITLVEVEFTCFKLASELSVFHEPIPDFSTRYPNVLESCLLTPFQAFGGSDAYKGFVSKAAILFYLMIKNHPFQNGNKRIAVTTLLVFMFKNGKWLMIDNQGLYNFAVWVAESPASVKSQVVQAIEKFLDDNLVPLS